MDKTKCRIKSGSKRQSQDAPTEVARTGEREKAPSGSPMEGERKGEKGKEKERKNA